MTKREFIQRCCIQMIDQHGPVTCVCKAEAMADELEENGYTFDKEESIVNIENEK